MPYGYTRARDVTQPGNPCPFARGICTSRCWAWDMEEAPKACSAMDLFAADMGCASPRDYYDECVIETLGKEA